MLPFRILIHRIAFSSGCFSVSGLPIGMGTGEWSGIVVVFFRSMQELSLEPFDRHQSRGIIRARTGNPQSRASKGAFQASAGSRGRGFLFSWCVGAFRVHYPCEQ